MNQIWDNSRTKEVRLIQPVYPHVLMYETQDGTGYAALDRHEGYLYNSQPHDTNNCLDEAKLACITQAIKLADQHLNALREERHSLATLVLAGDVVRAISYYDTTFSLIDSHHRSEPMLYKDGICMWVVRGFDQTPCVYARYEGSSEHYDITSLILTRVQFIIDMIASLKKREGITS